MEPQAFAVLYPKKGITGRIYICTANKDGSIPLNSKVVAELVEDSINIDLLEELLRRANSAT
jgi:hypothetical protein